MLDDAQLFVGRHGLSGWLAEVGGTPNEWSFCVNVVETEEPLEVPSAVADSRFAQNPLVTEDGVRSYLGVPLRTEDGHVLGSLCVIDAHERTFDSDHRALLEDLAAEVLAVLPPRS